jgi:hypothetical protein
MSNLTFSELTKITNSNFYWVSFLGSPAIFDKKNENIVLSVVNRRIYFREEYLPYGTSELFIDNDEAMIAATQIFNSFK